MEHESDVKNIQIWEDNVDEQHEFAQCSWHEGRDEGWKEEDHGEDRLEMQC